MSFVYKLLLFPLLLAFACLVAGCYGAVHNQISYTVAPEYFTTFKFDQFAIEPEFRNRIGAGIVGFLASWWMGLIIGFPIYMLGFFVRGPREFVRAYVQAALVVVVVTLIVGIGALAFSYVTITADDLPPWGVGRPGVTDPVAFARAGTMHNFSYLGGLIGMVVGVGWMIAAALRTWREARQAAGFV